MVLPNEGRKEIEDEKGKFSRTEVLTHGATCWQQIKNFQSRQLVVVSLLKLLSQARAKNRNDRDEASRRRLLPKKKKKKKY